jgi:Holliday junction resolvase RusA-like endonuclease
LIITVIGDPGPQGSKKLVGHDKKGRGILVESSKKVKPWREAVKYKAMEELEKCSLSVGRHCNGAFVGPVVVEYVFTLRKPKSARKGAVPGTRPDLSKLVRSTEDALTDAGVWEDDARVVSFEARKVYPGTEDLALDVPGVVIIIRGVRE